MEFLPAASEHDVAIMPGSYAMMDSQGDIAGADIPCCWDAIERPLAWQHNGHDVS